VEFDDVNHKILTYDAKVGYMRFDSTQQQQQQHKQQHKQQQHKQQHKQQQQQKQQQQHKLNKTIV